METAILAVGILVLAAVVLFGWLNNHTQVVSLQDIQDRLNDLQRAIDDIKAPVSAQNADIETVLESVEDIREVLVEASRRKTEREKKNEEPAMPQRSGRKFVGVAQRRAAAERTSQGPANRTERTRQANTQAMEG